MAFKSFKSSLPPTALIDLVLQKLCGISREAIIVPAQQPSGMEPLGTVFSFWFAWVSMRKYPKGTNSAPGMEEVLKKLYFLSLWCNEYLEMCPLFEVKHF